MTVITGEGGDGPGLGPSLKRSREDGDEDPNERPPQVPREPEVPDCPICFTPLVDDVVSLPLLGPTCGHSFHGACLRQAVQAGVRSEIGRDESGVWYRAMPPLCPLCRTRFVAAQIWADLAYVDQYPDGGQGYFEAAQQPAQVDDQPFGDGNGEDDPWYGGQGQDDQQQDDQEQSDVDSYESDSDSGSGYVHPGVTCGQCQQNLGHLERRVDDFLDDTDLDNPICYLCHGALADDDDGTHILVCQNCGAPSHFHD